MTSVFVIGVGMTQFARHRERLLEDLAREAVRTAVQSTKANVRGVCMTNTDFVAATFYAGTAETA